MIAVFLKYPTPGDVKTRLGETIGYERSAHIYKAFVEKLVITLSKQDNPVTFWVDDRKPLSDYKKWIGKTHNYAIQIGNTLGDRLHHAVKTTFMHTDKALLLGTDTPHLSGMDISSAYDALQQYASVIGPAYDGGYYALGLNRSDFDKPLPFSDINWSSESVFRQTLTHLIKRGSVYCLPTTFDVDTESDLNRLNHLKKSPQHPV